MLEKKEKKFPLREELVLCTVNRILGTTVFVKIDGYNKEGVIATSEVSPGRIRNIRDYVVPNKKIVCKVLRIDDRTGHIDLSLRRVKIKERAETLEKHMREKNAFAILKVVAKEKSEEIAKKIEDAGLGIHEFLQKIDEIKPESFSITQQQHEQLRKLTKEKPQKKILVRKKFEIKSEASDGSKRIKSVLAKALMGEENTTITYISAPDYLITIESNDYKKANKKLEKVEKKIVEEAKINECRVEFKE